MLCDKFGSLGSLADNGRPSYGVWAGVDLFMSKRLRMVLINAGWLMVIVAGVRATFHPKICRTGPRYLTMYFDCSRDFSMLSREWQLDTARKSLMLITNRANLVAHELCRKKLQLSVVRHSKLQSMREEDSPVVKVLQACIVP